MKGWIFGGGYKNGDFFVGGPRLSREGGFCGGAGWGVWYCEGFFFDKKRRAGFRYLFGCLLLAGGLRTFPGGFGKEWVPKRGKRGGILGFSFFGKSGFYFYIPIVLSAFSRPRGQGWSSHLGWGGVGAWNLASSVLLDLWRRGGTPQNLYKRFSPGQKHHCDQVTDLLALLPSDP